MEEYYDDDYLETLEEKLMDEDEDFNYIAPARTKVKKKRLKDPIFSASLSRVGWVIGLLISLVSKVL